jgi:hypothetical protein
VCVIRTRIGMKNAVFWDVAPCRSCVNRRFGGTYRLHLQSRKIRERGTSVSRWLHTADIQEDGILYSQRRENLKSYKNRQILLRRCALKEYFNFAHNTFKYQDDCGTLTTPTVAQTLKVFYHFSCFVELKCLC